MVHLSALYVVIANAGAQVSTLSLHLSIYGPARSDHLLVPSPAGLPRIRARGAHASPSSRSPLRQPERDSYVHAPTPMAHIVIVAPDWVWRMSRAISRRSYAHRRPRTASPSAILAHWPVGSQIFRTRSQSAHDAFRALPSTCSAARCQVD